MEIKAVEIAIPERANVVIGQAHFIKTVEDIYEAVATHAPGAEFGIAFSEASGACLIRHDGNSHEMEKAAIEACKEIASGHTFVVMIRKAFPISVLNALKGIQEVCGIFCATANPLIVVVAEEKGRRGVLGVIDGEPPKGVEGEGDKEERRSFLRKIGYKR